MDPPRDESLPAATSGTVNRLAAALSGGLFAFIFGRDPLGAFRSGRDVLLQTDPVVVDVKPLPSVGKPSGFSGLGFAPNRKPRASCIALSRGSKTCQCPWLRCARFGHGFQSNHGHLRLEP